MSIIGFAFYLQPIAMPMLREMPPGEVGYKILSLCMRITIMGAPRAPARPARCARARSAHEHALEHRPGQRGLRIARCGGCGARVNKGFKTL